MGHVLKMDPVFKEMIWGGSKLKDIYGYGRMLGNFCT